MADPLEPYLGIKLGSLIAGFLGGLVKALIMPSATPSGALFSCVIGALTAGQMGPVVTWSKSPGGTTLGPNSSGLVTCDTIAPLCQASPAILITKMCTSGLVTNNGRIEILINFSGAVSNQGNVPLHNASVCEDDDANNPPGVCDQTFNIGDLAAKGASPTWALTSVAVPRSWKVDDFVGLFAGMHALAAKVGMAIEGGDMSAIDGPAVLSLTVAGQASARPLPRSAAKPGWSVAVTGPLGGAALALRQRRALRLEPLLEQGKRLNGLGLCCGDISDGLVREMEKFADMSGCGCNLRALEVPVAGGASLEDALTSTGATEGTNRFAPQAIRALNAATSRGVQGATGGYDPGLPTRRRASD